MMSHQKTDPIITALFTLALALGGARAPDLLRAERGPLAGAAVELAPAVVEAAPAGQARAVFFQRSQALDLPGDTIILASTPDGAGALCTDDVAQIRLRAAAGAEQTWEHLFAEADRRTIRCIPAQTVPLAHGPGRYTVTITLSDLHPPVYSSRPYYLVPLGAAGAPAATGGTRPTAGPAAERPTAAEGVSSTPPIPRPDAPATNAAAQIAPGAPTAQPPTPPPTPAVGAAPTPAVSPAPRAATARMIGWWWIAGGALALAALAGGLLRRRRRRPRLHGIIDLRDELTGEVRTLLLHQYPAGVDIARAPLEPIAEIGQAARPVLAMIRPGPHGPTLAQPAAAAQPVPLRAGDELLLDRSVRLRYR